MTSSAPASRWAAPRSGYRLNAIALTIASRFLWLGYAIAFCATLFFFLFVPRARRASIAYASRLSRPHHFLSRQRFAFRHMLTYAILLLDRALMLARPDHGFALSVQGLEHFANALSQPPGGALLLSAHFGATEAAIPCLRTIGITKPLHIVMYRDNTDGTEQFHVQHRKLLADIPIISTTDPLNAGLRIMAALQKGDLVAMRADRTLAGKGLNTTLLGDPLQFPAGPFLASALSGIPTLYLDVVRIAHRHYRVLIAPAPPIDPTLPRDERIAQSASHFATHLDRLARRYPLQWGNFFDLWSVQPPQ